MSYKLYNSGSMLVFVNTAYQEKKGADIEYRVERLPKNKTWYEFNNLDAPILYSVYYDNPERDLIIDKPYTDFQDEFGNTFADDTELQLYLDNVLGSDTGNGAVNGLVNNGIIDASGRIRVSQMNTLLDIKLFNDNQPLLCDRQTIGTASQTHDGSDGVNMVVYADGDAAISQTFQRATYYSGKSHLIEATFTDGDNETDVVKRVGYFTSNTTTPFDSNKDGIWFEADGTDYRFRIQKNGIDILNVTQSSWNLSTFSDFDASKFNVLVIQFLYLGGTAVRLGFIHKGMVKWCHIYVHAGAVAGTFIKSPNKAIRYEIRSTGGSGSFKQVCAQVASEGSSGEVGVPSHISTTQTCTTSGNSYIVLAFRLKSAYSNTVITQESIGFNATTADDFEWFLVRNPTFATTPTFSDITNAAIQKYAGTILATDYGYTMQGDSEQGDSSTNSIVKNKLRPGTSINGTADIFAVIVKPKSNNLTLDVHMNLTEER